MEPRLKWNKIVLAVVTYGGGWALKFFKIILFHFRREIWNEIKIILAAKRIWFHFGYGSWLK